MARHLAIAAAAALVAVAINLLVYAAGRAAGGTFAFTAQGRPSTVDAVTVAGFSFLPLFLGLAVVALAGRLAPVALVAGPVLALATIALMTIPADFDTASTIALSLCHVTLAPIIVFAVRSMARSVREPITAS